MPRKEVDSRIPTLIRNCIQTNQRGLFLLVGDESKDVIAKLYYILHQLNPKSNKSVLWAYSKKLLGFTSHRAKREKKIQKEIKRGIREPNTEDPFEIFISVSDIRYTYYKETDKILGNTYGMTILQDFEGVTPNVLARTIETVQGGGLCILLLRGITSLKQLYTLSMSVHSRFRTEAHQDVVARFNERFLLSLGSCQNCLVIDDELNVLPISGAKGVSPLPPPDLDEPRTEAQKELDSIKESLIDTEIVGSLVGLTRTVDQAKAILTFIDTITEKKLRGTATLTAARGRGKSACLGVAIAAAIGLGYSNIFVTSPSPENLKTLFQFIFNGFDALGYQDHTDYQIVQSTNPDFQKAIVRVNVTRTHRQTIQYIRPEDAHVLGQCELLVIDEAAAIPLPVVKKLIGSYLVFMASTVNGYEGTGRSLSLKLIKQLREQSRLGATAADGEMIDRSTGKTSKSSDDQLPGTRSLREITLEEPIRYSQGDAVEKWLNSLLVLETPRATRLPIGYPDPETCHLLKINRDTLFSFHPVAERFLQQLVQLFVASHYKNTPDDLQLLSDAPSHELYVLCAPLDPNSNRLPEPLCAIQVALEGQISRQSVLNSLSRGSRPAGDLIPWLVSQQFQDDEFASLSGARVVRIATSPDFTSKGYGAKALSDLISFYEGKFVSLSEGELENEKNIVRVTDEELENGTLKDEISVRDITTLPPLFSKLSECRPKSIEYVGVSYGLTQELHKFWRRNLFAPVYLRQTPNDLTGEHTCVMLRPLESSDKNWLGSYANDFHSRFLSLLSYRFRTFNSVTALGINESATSGARLDPSYSPPPFTKESLDQILTPFDMKRLAGYANNVLDYHVILDLMPRVSEPYFRGRLNEVHLTGSQRAMLLAVALQRKDLDEVATDLSIPTSQILAMFMKIVKKFVVHFEGLVSGAIAASLPKDTVGVSVADASGIHDDELVDTRFNPLEKSLEEELEEGGDKAMKEIRRKQRELIDSLPLDRYEVEGDNPDWDDAEKQVRNAAKRGYVNPVVSIKSSKTKRKVGPTAAEVYEEEFGEKPQKKAKKSKKSH
ncbi:putative tRNA cytidine acetyltransferase [Rosellinia necatrix]|uniref:RNA cytidine acetyltransferase n=1 Tax=Rosellinia necatrix TaxID=77044 RepID=A0A1W2TIS5_ROSNE|nr:putative tRNA cytidine acetyltransferase [Rosellinia necatrix]